MTAPLIKLFLSIFLVRILSFFRRMATKFEGVDWGIQGDRAAAFRGGGGGT